MTDFIINTPYHKRWWLPDQRHQYNSVLRGDTFYTCVIDSLTGESKNYHSIKIASGYEDLLLLSQELANKKYPRQLRHKSNDHRRRIGL